MDVITAISGRRSIRRYKPDPIDEEILNKVLEAVRQAPSWANTQCWRLVVVKDPAIKTELVGTMFTISDRPNKTAEAMKVAPLAIAFCAEVGKSGFTHREPREIATDKGEYWYMFDVAVAMENLCLAAHAYGLGTVIIGAFDAKKAAELLEVPDGQVVVALTPLGYPDESPSARPRKEISEIVFTDKFGAI